MSENSEKADWPILNIPKPTGIICDICIQDSEQTGINGKLIATYCNHNLTGGVMGIDINGKLSGVWILYHPISGQAFAEKVNSILITAAEIIKEKGGLTN